MSYISDNQCRRVGNRRKLIAYLTEEGKYRKKCTRTTIRRTADNHVNRITMLGILDNILSIGKEGILEEMVEAVRIHDYDTKVMAGLVDFNL